MIYLLKNVSREWEEVLGIYSTLELAFEAGDKFINLKASRILSIEAWELDKGISSDSWLKTKYKTPNEHQSHDWKKY